MSSSQKKPEDAVDVVVDQRERLVGSVPVVFVDHIDLAQRNVLELSWRQTGTFHDVTSVTGAE